LKLQPPIYFAMLAAFMVGAFLSLFAMKRHIDALALTNR
jgi:hypothetical protein